MISQLHGACVQNKLQLQSIAAVQNMEQVEMCSSVFIQGDENSLMVQQQQQQQLYLHSLETDEKITVKKTEC